MVIGITGHPASGKDIIADYLVSKGYLKISGGDILREEMIKRKLPTGRESVHAFVAHMRRQYGNGYPANEIIKRIHGNVVVSGIRNTEELKIFTQKFGKEFRLIAVEAPVKQRYAWAQKRDRTGDNISFEQFIMEEEKEKSAESGSHEVTAVITMADVVVENNGTPEDLYRKIDTYFASL